MNAERGYDPGFHEILGHSPPAPPPQTKEFLLKHLIYKVFHMKSARFQNYELLGDHQV